MAGEEFEGVPVGLGLAEEAAGLAGPEGIVVSAAMQAAEKEKERKSAEKIAKEQRAKSKEEAKDRGQKQPPQYAQAPPQYVQGTSGGQSAKKAASWLWGKFTGQGDPAVTNLNFMGLVALLILAYQILSWITGFRPDFRLFGLFFIFILLVVIRTNVFAAAGWALADFVFPAFFISLITQNVPAYFKVLTPVFNLMPILPSAVQNSLIVLVIIFAPSLDFVFFVKNVGETEKPQTTIYGIARLLQLLFILWFIVGFALSLGAIGFDILKPVANMATLTSEGRAALADAGRWALNSPKLISEGLTSLYKQQINIATAGAYTEGEQATVAPVGVKVEMQKPNILYSGQPAVVWAQITALSLPEKSLDVATSCLSDDPKKGSVGGKTFPQQFTMDIVGRTEAVRCSFDSLERGNRIINFTATFNSITSSQLAVSFVDRGRLLAAPEKFPTLHLLSVSSAGPAKFNIGLQSPVALSTTPPYPQMSITIEPVGSGSITTLKKFIINVPQGIELVECDRPVVPTSDGQRPGYSAYTLSDTGSVVSALGETPFQSFSCFMKTNNPELVLKGSKVEAGQEADRYIFVNGEYDFRAIVSQTVNVQKGATAATTDQQGAAAGTAAGSQAGTATSQTPEVAGASAGSQAGSAVGNSLPSNTGSESSSVSCSSYDARTYDQQAKCQDKSESGVRCVYLVEKDMYRCRRCQASLCCGTSNRNAGIPNNIDNIGQQCGISCGTVSC